MWIWKLNAAITIIALIGAFTGCSPDPMTKASDAFSKEAITQGVQLTKTYCNTCHGVGSREMDAMLAPPLLGIRDFYIERYPEPEEFVEAIVAFTQHPKREQSLMPFAVKEFGLKASVSMPESELRLTAIALYAEQVERPKWIRDYRKRYGESADR